MTIAVALASVRLWTFLPTKQSGAREMVPPERREAPGVFFAVRNPGRVDRGLQRPRAIQRGASGGKASRCRSQPTAVVPLQKARAPEHKRQREIIRDAS